MRRIRVPFVFLLVASTCLGAPDFSDGLLDREAALAAARDVTVARYPDANQVLVDGIQWIAYQPDGTFEQWHEDYVKVLTEEGRRGLTTLSSYFTIPYQRGPEDCRIAKVEIVKPDGTALAIDVEAQSRIMVDPSSMSMNIYNPNEKIIRLNVAGLEVGDVLHYVMFDRIVKARMEDSWNDWIVFEGPHPIQRSVVEIHAPAAAPLRSIALKSEVEGTVTHSVSEKDGEWCYRWEAKDVPRMFPEPNMPPIHTVVQRLLVSTLSDWETVSRWYWNLSEPHYEATDAMRVEAARLVEGLDDPLQRIDALFRYVAQEIRYMGITVEANAPGYEPHDVKDTFEARHGVCRDKAALLVVLLRLAGIEAFPALIHYGPKKDSEVPQPYFNHAIVAARYEEEKGAAPVGRDGEQLALLHSSTGHSYVLMDPTAETSAKLLPAYLNDKSVLVATPEGEPLLTSPVDPAENNLMRVTTSGRIDAAGTLTARTQLAFDGVNDNAYRAHFARSKPEDRRRFVEGLIRNTVPGAHVTDIEIRPADMLDTAHPLSIRVDYDADAVAVTGGGKTLLPLPALGTHVGMVNFVIGKTGLRKRKYPLVTDIACGTTERISLELDPALGEVISLPAVSTVSDASFAWNMAVSSTGALLEAESDFRLKAVEFPPADYLELKKGLETIEVALREMPILNAGDTETAPDALVLSEAVDYDLLDASSWTETRAVSKKVLTYAGKKNNAEIKLGYNPAWETVSLEDVRVVDKEGAAHAIQPKELNEMDAPWVGAAPRYPGAKTLVASLPGVDIGSTIEYRIVRTVRDHPFFSVYEPLRTFDRIVRKSVTVTAPEGLALRVGDRLFDGVRTRETVEGEEGKRVRYHWIATDSAPIRKEDGLPPAWYFTPTVFVSAGAWNSYAAWLEEALAAPVRGQREVERKVRELVGSERDPWTKLRRIRDFVAVHIRDAGPSLVDLPISSLTPADTTLRDGYGNTTDQSILLYVLLKKAGFKPEFVLASFLPDIAPYRQMATDYPDPGLFPDVLVRVSSKGLALAAGEAVYLNDTDQYAAIGASRHEGKLCLALPDGMPARIVPAKPSMLETAYTLALSENGDTVIAKTLRFYGNRFGPENKNYTEMTPEERDRYFQELVAGVSEGAEPVGELMTDFSGYPGVVAFTVKARNYAIRSDEFLYVQFPELFDGLFALRSDTRENPMYSPVFHHRKMSVRCELPAGFEIVFAPEDWTCDDVAGADVELSARVAAEQGDQAPEFRFEAEATRAPSLVSSSQYRALLEIDKHLSHKRTSTLLLRKVTAEESREAESPDR